jgi:hypothetical protein
MQDADGTSYYHCQCSIVLNNTFGLWKQIVSMPTE